MHDDESFGLARGGGGAGVSGQGRSWGESVTQLPLGARDLAGRCHQAPFEEYAVVWQIRAIHGCESIHPGGKLGSY